MTRSERQAVNEAIIVKLGISDWFSLALNQIMNVCMQLFVELRTGIVVAAIIVLYK